jgi:cold shock protein
MGDQRERGSKRRGFDSGHSVGEYSPRPAIVHAEDDDDGPVLDATVKWFKSAKGFGFVVLGDGSGEAFLHIEVLERAGYANIHPCTKLRVRVAQGQKGRQVTAITDILHAGDAGRWVREAPRRPSGPPAWGPATEVAGTVKWYDASKGFGFAEAEDGQENVFIHVSVLERAGLRGLTEAQRIVMQVVIDPKGRKAMALRLTD